LLQHVNKSAVLACLLAIAAAEGAPSVDAWRTEYDAAQHRLATGWNTWNTNSVLSQVLLPEGVAITVGLHSLSLSGQQYLPLAQPGGGPRNPSPVILGPHAIDGSYSDLTIKWQGMRARFQSATVDSDLVLLITPLELPDKAPLVDIHVGMLWNRPGTLRLENGAIEATLPSRTFQIFSVGKPAEDPMIQAGSPYWAFSMDDRVAVSAGRRRTLREVVEAIDEARIVHERECGRPGVSRDTVEAVESAVGWDTIYDPIRGRVITPVSRPWDVGWGGYVLFEWDTFFAGYLAGFFSRDLAYANVIEMLNEATPAGFIPNYSSSRGIKSLDRSEPPVGALVVRDLYRRYQNPWFLEATFPRLLAWNRWWDGHRQVDGYLVWGSDPAGASHLRDDPEVDTLQAAKFESGLDNSPMFDAARYDRRSHRMRQADVGLMSLYIADCDALGEIAARLGRDAERDELQRRSAGYRSKLATLWSPDHGIYLNKDLDTGALSLRLSPTNFYPLLAKAPTTEQAERMVREHLRNPAEFWGDWVLPATPRNDPAFKDNEYWRGRIWGPMNFLVYLGLRNYPLSDVRQELARKSEALLLKDWRARGHIHENYSAVTGEGDDVTSSDAFYHWGALLGAVQLLERGQGD
jgi:putative isomerase